MTDQLILAVEAGDTASVKTLLQQGAAINGRDALGRTPAMVATHSNHVETVAALIQAGAEGPMGGPRSRQRAEEPADRGPKGGPPRGGPMEEAEGGPDRGADILHQTTKTVLLIEHKFSLTTLISSITLI